MGLVIDEALGPLIRTRLEAFDRVVARARSSIASKLGVGDELKRLDPAETILDLRVCDPAMGSGHLLVRVVDDFADRVLGAMTEAESVVDGYRSPLAERIRAIRRMVSKNAEVGGWNIDKSRLDDHHIVRRIVLRRCIHGVDKNPMAVELARVALLLHTFTVGAPLDFLDHHT